MREVRLSEVVGGGYGRFWHDRSRYRVVKGGKGAKKSASAALNFIYRLMRYPSANLLVVRGVMNTHRDSTYAQLLWACERLGVSRQWEHTVSPLEMTRRATGQKILFRGFDDVLKLASATVPRGVLCWVWIEEAYEIGREEDFDKLDLTVPRGEVPPELFKQTTLTFNPWDGSHWLKRRFFDNPSPGVSTYSVNYLCNEWLDDADRAVFERMKAENPRRYAVAGLGEWGAAEGLIYTKWEVTDFDDDRFKFVYEDGVKRDVSWKYRAFFGLDYGYSSDPTAFIAFRCDPVGKEIYVFDEFCRTGMLNSDIAREIAARGYRKERIRADCAEPKSNEELRRNGIEHVMPSQKGPDSLLHGIAEISEYRIYVHPRCRHTAAELAAYRWSEIRGADGKPRPEDRNNHLMDAMRYAFADVKFFKAIPSDDR